MVQRVFYQPLVMGVRGTERTTPPDLSPPLTTEMMLTDSVCICVCVVKQAGVFSGVSMRVTIAHVQTFQDASGAVECISRTETHTSLVTMQRSVGAGRLFCPSTAAYCCLCLSPRQQVKVIRVPGDHSSVVTAPVHT